MRAIDLTVAAAVGEHPDAFTGIGSVDPHKESAVDEIAALGLRGVKFHPSLQAFAPDDEKFWPVSAACESHGLLALFHTGTSGIGARQPGGQGIRIDYSHPLKLDAVAAAFPGLTVVAAHFGWPWHMDLLAIAQQRPSAARHRGRCARGSKGGVRADAGGAGRDHRRQRVEGLLMAEARRLPRWPLGREG